MLRCSATRAMTRTLHEPWPRPKRPPSARDPPGQSAALPENRRVNQPETVSAILILGLEGGGGGVWAIFGGLKGPGQGGRGGGLRRARVSRSSVQEENTR